MDKCKDRRWVVERVKDVLILLLTLSALWLGTRSQLLGPMREYFQEETPQINPITTQQEALAEAVRPLRMIAALEGGTGIRRYAVQCDQAAADELFQQVASLLSETVSGAGAAEPVDRRRWEQALLTAPSVVFDFQGRLPIEVLVGWLTGDATQLTGTVRRLVLAVEEETMVLYYCNQEDGGYYRCLSSAEHSENLRQVLSELAENQASFAFESESYQMLDPDTLVQETISDPVAYSAINPVADGRASLEELMKELGFPVNGSSFYSAGSEHVARSGNNSVRLSDKGTLIYQAENTLNETLVAARGWTATSVFEQVEACRRMAAATLSVRCGDARLYLQSVQEVDQGLEVRFGYCLNGIPVQLEEGSAAWFLVQDGMVTQFEFHLRSYSSLGTTTALLPMRQAVAALEALGLEGEELQLMYSDSGSDLVTAGWTAVDHQPKEGG